MAKKSINVIGIMIGDEYNDFKLYEMNETWNKHSQADTHSETGYSGSSWVVGFKNILGYLSVPSPVNTQFVVVYDVSCPNKEDHIKKLLTEINKIKKNDLLPTLISIGHEPSPWNEEIINQVSSIKEVPSTAPHNDLFKKMIESEFNNTKKVLLAADKAEELNKNNKIKLPQTKTTSTSSMMGISMMVLGGFIAAAGITAVAIAFTLLNAATFGAAGLAVAIVGVAATLSGVGLFATGAYKNKQTTSDDSLKFSENLVY